MANQKYKIPSGKSKTGFPLSQGISHNQHESSENGEFKYIIEE